MWAVQRANVSLRNGCEIRGCGRSGIVSFGNARVSVRESNISHSALHGICARGASHIELADAAITNSGVRGVYVYHNVTLEMRRSSVVGTRDAQAAAVQVEALRPGDQCRLRMDDRCRVEGNRGQGVVVKGNVAVEALGAAGDAVC